MRKPRILKKMSPLVILLIIISSIGAVSAMYWIFSNVVDDPLNYQVTLVTSRAYSEYTLTATLTDNGVDMQGETVIFEMSIDAGVIWTEIGTDTTSNAGVAILVWSATANGDYSFRATYAVA